MEYKTGSKIKVIVVPLILILAITLVCQIVFLMNRYESAKVSDNDDNHIIKTENTIINKKRITILDFKNSTLGKNLVKFSKNGTRCEFMWQKNVKSDNIIEELKKFDDIGVNIKKLNIKSENFNVNIVIEGDFGAEE